jgi:hypothetical protein
MAEHTWFETIKVEGGQLGERIGQLFHEGNVRRIVIRQDEQVVAEFPLTIGVVGTVIAPIAAAIGALAALLTRCTIEIERTEPAPVAPEVPATPLEVGDLVDEPVMATDG